MRSLLEDITSARTETAVELAWSRYLETTRAAGPHAYEQVEERAWRRLARQLDALGRPLPGVDEPR